MRWVPCIVALCACDPAAPAPDDGKLLKPVKPVEPLKPLGQPRAAPTSGPFTLLLESGGGESMSQDVLSLKGDAQGAEVARSELHAIDGEGAKVQHGHLDAAAVTALFEQLNRLDWPHLQDANAPVPDAGSERLRIVRGGVDHEVSVTGGRSCPAVDAIGAVRKAVEGKLTDEKWKTVEVVASVRTVAKTIKVKTKATCSGGDGCRVEGAPVHCFATTRAKIVNCFRTADQAEGELATLTGTLSTEAAPWSATLADGKLCHGDGAMVCPSGTVLAKVMRAGSGVWVGMLDNHQLVPVTKVFLTRR